MDVALYFEKKSRTSSPSLLPLLCSQKRGHLQLGLLHSRSLSANMHAAVRAWSKWHSWCLCLRTFLPRAEQWESTRHNCWTTCNTFLSKGTPHAAPLQSINNDNLKESHGHGDLTPAVRQEPPIEEMMHG
eukprot:1148073-Pelagomonas_calceolata.AAC.24